MHSTTRDRAYPGVAGLPASRKGIGVLPLIDEHAIAIPVPRKRVWEGLIRYADTVLLRRRLLGLVLGTVPPAGFEISESIPDERLVLTGRHRFARYRLAFQLADGTAGGTVLSATTCAAFPGLPGRAYRTIVVGTGVHSLVVRHMLRAIASLARDEGYAVRADSPRDA